MKNSNPKFTIYKAECGNEIYIGKTAVGLEKRKKLHHTTSCKKYGNYKRSNAMSEHNEYIIGALTAHDLYRIMTRDHTISGFGEREMEFKSILNVMGFKKNLYGADGMNTYDTRQFTAFLRKWADMLEAEAGGYDD